MSNKTSTRNKARDSRLPKSITTVDTRGQLVISKEVRDLAHIKPGDKIAQFTAEGSKKITLIKVDDLIDVNRVDEILK